MPERIMSILRGFLPCLLVLGLITLPISADVLLIDGEPRVVERAEQPTRGMHERTVLTRFGEPGTRHDAVGEPPISRWDYNDYSVFFEGPFVIHTVVRKEVSESR
jgi:hypothetical protein